MSKTKPEFENEDKPAQPVRQPLIIPVLPNDEVDPIPPEPIEAPPDPDNQQSPIDENPKEPKLYV
jgi:hypothetical protein